MTNAETRRERRGDEEETFSSSPRLRVSASSTSSNLQPQARRRLINFLIGKLFFEAVFVCVLAVAFHYGAFNPFFRGWLDHADARQVWGWALDASHPASRVEVQLYIDGRFAASRTADRSRPDVRDAGRANDEWHGFAFDTPKVSQGIHEARVYAVHESGGGTRRTMRQIGETIHFRVDAVSAGNAQSEAHVVREENR